MTIFEEVRERIERLKTCRIKAVPLTNRNLFEWAIDKFIDDCCVALLKEHAKDAKWSLVFNYTDGITLRLDNPLASMVLRSFSWPEWLILVNRF